MTDSKRRAENAVPVGGVVGGCLCGRVRYRLCENPLAFYACHCTDCQRQTGSSFGLSMFVRAESLVVEAGAPAQFEVAMDDGRKKRGAFCAACATRLWGEPLRVPTIKTLRPGTLDDPFRFEPVGQIWTASAQPWVKLPSDQPCYPGQPEDSLELVRIWRASRARAEEAG